MHDKKRLGHTSCKFQPKAQATMHENMVPHQRVKALRGATRKHQFPAGQGRQKAALGRPRKGAT